MVRLALSLFAIQAGFHGFTAALPVALARAGVSNGEIGLIVGIAALVQVPAAFAAGAVVDRIGGLRVLAIGGVAYLVGCVILLLPGVEPGGPTLPFVVARFFQGIGIAGNLPAAMSLVPRLTSVKRRGVGLAFIGSAHNLTMVAMPPVSIAVLSATSLHGVALTMTAAVLFGLALVVLVPFRFQEPEPADAAAPTHPAARRHLGLALRRSWVPLLGMVVLYITHWGVITAYLPQRAEAAGADIGLFFAADGIAVLLSRVPTGWLADHVKSLYLMLSGLTLNALSVLMLTTPPTTPLLIGAGLLGGVGGGLVMTPILLELARRSTDDDRGSAFSLFSASLASALVVGSIGMAPLVQGIGFDAALLVGLAGIAAAGAVAISDRELRTHPQADRHVGQLQRSADIT
jgi:MFS family permease